VTDLEEADLVIAADGVSSATREGFGRHFGSSVSRSRGLFIWCGSETVLPGMVFAPVTTDEGMFVAHAYPYAEGRSTWVVETDVESWRRAGFDASQTTQHGTDERAIDYLSRVFADLLQGHKLIGNKSQWALFRTVTSRSWSHDNIVLLGDAAANAHPSVGSGTKLALESAIALDAALAAEPDTTSAAAAYEAARRPAIEQFQDRARRSQLWWESLDARLHLSPERLAVAFLTRTGVVSVEALASSAPTLVRAAAAQFAGVRDVELPQTGLSRWVAERGRATTPADSQLPVDCIDPWGSGAAEILDKARSLKAAGAAAVELVGGSSRAALLDRLALAERIRAESGLQVHVAAPTDGFSDIADALVAGRLDATSTLVP
jgi:anthraniloyl-CoA monooxygenase